MSSHLPMDMTPTTGLNGLMEQYPDEDYGAGVLNPDILPPKGSASSDDGAGEVSLPDGIVLAGDGELGIEFAGDSAMSLADLDQNVLASTVIDLSWLEVDEADLSRLPKAPHANVVPELEEAFAQHRGLPGVHFHANIDPEVARYRASLTKGAASGDVPFDALQVLARKAMRLSAANPDVPFSGIMAQLKTALTTMPEVHGHLRKLQPILARVAEEHGLAGRVFIRAEAYPKYEQGEWADEIRRHASAKYIVVPKRKHGMAHHVRGVCTITGKRVVSSVPWERARQEYAPKLKATGRSVSAEGDPRVVLKAAFARKPRAMREVSSSRPQHAAPSERVSFEDAQTALRAHKPERRAVSRKAQEQERVLKDARLQIAKWVRAGSLTKKQGTALVSSNLAPGEMLKAATAAITRVGSPADFSGTTGLNVNELPDMSPQMITAALADSREARSETQAKITHTAAERRRTTTRTAKSHRGMEARVARVIQAIDRGIRGNMLKQLIRTTIRRTEWREAAKLLDPILKKTRALQGKAPRRTAVFSGPVGREHVQMRQANLTPSPREVETYIRWARLTIAEGILGRDLDALLQTRWAKPVRVAGAQALQVLRDRHEGLSAHLYVDAGAYASNLGTKGCDEGALQHRTGPARFVLAFDRCAGCTSSNRRRSGTSLCQKYGKDIISANQLPQDESRAYQRRTLAVANMGDAEATASLFAPAYDPNEFELTSPLQIDEALISSAPIEPLQDIWFGDDVPLELDPLADPTGISFN